MTNKEKFLKIVSAEASNAMAEVKQRKIKRAMLRESQKIALKVLTKLDELGWTQKDLAQEMNVSPQQISKIVSGTQNLTIETQIKLQEILDIPVLASYYEKEEEKKEQRDNYYYAFEMLLQSYTLEGYSEEYSSKRIFKEEQLLK